MRREKEEQERGGGGGGGVLSEEAVRASWLVNCGGLRGEINSVCAACAAKSIQFERACRSVLRVALLCTEREILLYQGRGALAELY
eukprot:1970671-Rhodomonas_salina.1